MGSVLVSVRGSFVVVGVESGPVNCLSLLNCLDVHHWKGRETTSYAKLYYACLNDNKFLQNRPNCR